MGSIGFCPYFRAGRVCTHLLLSSGGGGSSGDRCATVQSGVSGSGRAQLQRSPRETLTPQKLREWYVQRGTSRSSARCRYVIRTGVDVFALDYDVILTAMNALTIGAEGDCSLCVLPAPGIEAAALGASESALPGTAPAEALHTFTLDSGASRCFFRYSTTLTPLSAPVLVRVADPYGAQSLPVPPLFFRARRIAALQDAMVTTTTPGGQRVAICTCTRTGRSITHVHSSARSLPPLPPSPAPPCLPCVEGLQRAAPHSSSFPPTSAPLQTLRMDVWGPARVTGQGCERYFLLVVDDYTRYTCEKCTRKYDVD
ncbi:unnamed protein product [Closterium sp. NIES-54]